EAVKATGADATMIFVPPVGAADAIMEAADAGIQVIVAITEGIPVLDMAKAKRFLKTKLGAREKGIGVISRSGTLTYEAVFQLTALGLPQTTCVGIGGDPVIGTSQIDL